MRQPDKYIDNKTIALLTEHPGVETPEEPVYGQVGCGDGVDSSCSTSRYRVTSEAQYSHWPDTGLGRDTKIS